MADLKELRENLNKSNIKLHKLMNIKMGETAAPGYMGRCALADPTRVPLNEEYIRQVTPEYEAFAKKVREILAGMPEFDRGEPITPDKLWVWGGPTPLWGGSSLKDTLMRSIKYFGAENGVYVYGPTTAKMIARHAGVKKLLAMVTNTCRAPGQQPESDAECAEKLSRLSLKYPFVSGGMMDDMSLGFKEITQKKVDHVAEVSRNLKKHNPALELFGTVYCHELGSKDFSALLPYLDGVNLWHWHMEELLDVEKNVELCRTAFPGKKILMGLFLHDYGVADAGAVPELLLHQLKAARQLLAEGKITGLVILGDREILKWPEQAAVVKGFIEAK